jgi:uncharacterized RDD family membrane protein YckC
MDEEQGPASRADGAQDPRRPAPPGYGAAPGDARPPTSAGASSAAPRVPEEGLAGGAGGGTVYGRVTRFGQAEAARPGGPSPHPQAGWTAAAPPGPPGAPGLPAVPWDRRPGPPPLWAGPAPWSAPGPQGWTAGPPPPSWRREDYAPWIRRVGGELLDHAPAYVGSVLVLVSYVPLYVGLLRGDLAARPTWWLLVLGLLLSLASVGWNVYNRWYVAGRTGQSWGKRATGTWLVSAVDGRPVGMLNAFLRDLLHVLDGAAYVGYLWPLWDERRQTFADKVIDTVVVRIPVAPLTDEERARRP